MTDIVERLRAWVYTDSQYATAREAADEIDRLRGLLSRTGTDSAKTGDDATECHSHGEKLPERERVANHPANPDSSTLTAAEREAVAWAAAIEPEPSGRWTQTQEAAWNQRAATLRALLERL